MAFDIERFLELSKAVDTSDLDWDYIRRVGVTDDEARALRYMADIESHTIIYLRAGSTKSSTTAARSTSSSTRPGIRRPRIAIRRSSTTWARWSTSRRS
jgi:hypothetical protein